MRFITALVSLGLSLSFFTPSLAALTVGGPGLPQKKGVFTTAFEGNYVNHKGRLHKYTYIRQDASGNIIKQGGLVSGEDVRNVEGESYLPLVSSSYSLMDKLEVFFKVGGALSDWQFDWYQDGAKVSRTDIESDWGVACGGGIKATLLEFKDDWKIGLNLSYLWFQNDTSEQTTRDSSGKKYKIEQWAVIDNFWEGVNSATYKDGQNIHQWQAAFYLSKPIDKFLPYAGVKYFDFLSKYEAKIEGFDAGGTSVGTEEKTLKAKSKGTVGVFAGVDYQFNEDIIFSIEASFIDELAGTAGFTLVF